MFDKFKSVSALAGLMANQDKLKDSARKIREQMERTQFEGVGGQGAARAFVTGSMRVLRVELSPALLSGMNADPRTRDLASGLIADAVNDAIGQAQARLKETFNAHAKELGLPEGLPDLGSLLS
ncbi:MAG: YbaB/EbfC family nucleoid-associated protein [Phycisphaerales bacterium]|nr:YbaB/EbfC family nucleoid-associated protein [Phycisphaerales bacterium]